jgi:hypothetical protein
MLHNWASCFIFRKSYMRFNETPHERRRMSENFTGIVVGTVVGLVAAHFGAQAYLAIKEKVHEDELAEERHAGFRDGYAAANNNPENVRKRFKELFGSGEPEGDKATTARS